MTSQLADMASSSNFSDVFLFLLSSLGSGPSFMSISSLVLELWQFTFIRDWPEIRKSETPLVWVLPNTRRLGLVRDTKFGMNVSNEMLLNDAKCQGYNFYCFWVIKGKPKGGGGGKITTPTQYMNKENNMKHENAAHSLHSHIRHNGYQILVFIKFVFQKKKQLPEVFYKRGFLKIFGKFVRKHCCRSLFLIRL